MNALLEKFNQVEIKADSRISESDRAFCEAQQEAYEKARDVLKQLADLAGRAQQEQFDILERNGKEVYITYLGSKYDVGAEKYLDLLDKTHRDFVKSIVGYFRHKYHVSLDDGPIYDAFVQPEPEEPAKLGALFYVSRNGWTDETRKEYNEVKAAYDKAVEDAETHNRELVIRYEKILDYIFAQLGGGSFRDTALKELKDACHAACWYKHNGQPKFEQKKSVIRYTGYGCSIDYIHEKYKDKGEESEFRLTDDMKKVMDALNYFELGTQSHTLHSISELCSYRVVGQKHEIGGEKVVGVQLYKSNRVDIRFSSEAYAREFAEQFMGTAA